ncbi:SUMO-activating enzyme subunit 1-like [Penaeus indicus]|uniref:SUMO-activating enzyme subunit 1-like n=1 Tax=Penaeus indicus TaxID=29960 RepID=UPI00300D42CA
MSNSSMKMVEKNLTNITEDEAALYDRQIRLWGLDAQKRLRASRVLVAGVCGMGAEVTKNLVLSGIKSLMLLDHRNLTEIDVCANFLAPHDAVGQNEALTMCEILVRAIPKHTYLVGLATVSTKKS